MATIYRQYDRPRGTCGIDDSAPAIHDSRLGNVHLRSVPNLGKNLPGKVSARPQATGALSRSIKRRAKRRTELVEELLIVGGVFFLTFFVVQTSLPMGS